jgi:hypothetical protein
MYSVSLDHFKVLLVGIHGSSAEGGNLANYMIFQRTDKPGNSHTFLVCRRRTVRSIMS